MKHIIAFPLSILAFLLGGVSAAISLDHITVYHNRKTIQFIQIHRCT